MSRIKVLLRGAVISEIGLIPEKEYKAGRKEGSDIRLQAEKGISREHFVLKFSDGKWLVKAVSRFGELYSLGQKVEEISLEHGQSFQVPPYEFQFVEVPESDVPHAAPQAQVSESERTVIGAAPQVPYIKIVNSMDQVTEMLRLEVGDLWVAGRDPSCQIVIPDQRVSRRQFEIHKVNGIYTILDLASVNGTFLNGATVSSTDPQPLKSGDLITVLDNKLFFELHDPNFKFKIEKIDIPSLPLDEQNEEPLGGFQFEEDAPAEQDPSHLPMEIPNISVDDVPPQLNPDGSGGPFTGMPPGQDPNQYYGFTPEQPPPLTPWKKFLSNKPLVAAVALIFVAGAYYISEQTNTPPPKKVVAQPKESEPFSMLTKEKQNEVKELYSMADQMLTQQKYELALERLRKIHEILPLGYKESRSMQLQAEQSLLTFVQQQEDEKRRIEEEEKRKKFNDTIAECQKLLTPTVEFEQVQTCLAPAAAIDATSEEYSKVIQAAQKIITEREMKAAEERTKEEQILKLKQMFARAEKIQNDGFAFKAIKEYEIITKTTELDPDHLREKAKTRIEYIKSKIGEKTQKNLSNADALYKEGKLKDAIIALRAAQTYDPENKSIKERIDQYTLELRRQMMAIYQDSIIDESYGVVDNTETRQGAKDKWKKIVETDLDDGEYYRKAVIKLRKYGAL